MEKTLPIKSWNLYGCLTLICASITAHGVPKTSEARLAQVWRTRVVNRLRILMPTADPRSASGVSRANLAKVIGTSRTFATLALKGPDFLNYDHAIKVAKKFGVSPEYVLAADITNQYLTLEDLEKALDGESTGFRSLMIKLYATRFAVVPVRPSFDCEQPGSVAAAWRSQINRRLAMFLPSRSKSVSKISTTDLGLLIGTTQQYGVAIVSGSNLLSVEQASILGRAFGQSAEFFLASDWLASNFASYEDLERHLDREKPSVRSLVLRSYVAGRDHDAARSGCRGLD